MTEHVDKLIPVRLGLTILAVVGLVVAFLPVLGGAQADGAVRSEAVSSQSDLRSSAYGSGRAKLRVKVRGVPRKGARVVVRGPLEAPGKLAKYTVTGTRTLLVEKGTYALSARNVGARIPRIPASDGVERVKGNKALGLIRSVVKLDKPSGRTVTVRYRRPALKLMTKGLPEGFYADMRVTGPDGWSKTFDVQKYKYIFGLSKGWYRIQPERLGQYSPRGKKLRLWVGGKKNPVLARASIVYVSSGNQSCKPAGTMDQAVCYNVTNNARRWSSPEGGLEPLVWLYHSWDNVPDGHSTNKATVSAPQTITDTAFWEMYQSHCCRDAGGTFHYAAPPGIYPNDTDSDVGLYAIDPNTGTNDADCTGQYKYTICIASDPPDSGSTISVDYTLNNLPFQLQILNNMKDAALEQVADPTLSRIGIDQSYGTPERSIAPKTEASWLGYLIPSSNEQQDPMPTPSPSASTLSFNDMTVTYSLQGDPAFVNSRVTIDVNIDDFGNPQASRCSVNSASSYETFFCDVSLSGSGTTAITVTANIHQ